MRTPKHSVCLQGTYLIKEVNRTHEAVSGLCDLVKDTFSILIFTFLLQEMRGLDQMTVLVCDSCVIQN